MVQLLILSPGKCPLCLCVCVSVAFFTAVLSYYTHFTAKYSENAFYASISTKNVQTSVLTVRAVRRCVFMERMVYVAVCSQFDLVHFYGGILDATYICSSKCFSIFYDYTKVHDLLCDGMGTVLTRA